VTHFIANAATQTRKFLKQKSDWSNYNQANAAISCTTIKKNKKSIERRAPFKIRFEKKVISILNKQIHLYYKHSRLFFVRNSYYFFLLKTGSNNN